MRLWLLKHSDALRTTYWFLPAVMAAAAVALALLTLELDRVTQSRVTPEWG